jgi:hypothetical protein
LRGFRRSRNLAEFLGVFGVLGTVKACKYFLVVKVNMCVFYAVKVGDVSVLEGVKSGI